MRKSYVLDTNVLLYDPLAINMFRGNDLTIPYVVLEELEKLKKGDSEKAKAARTVLRFIDSTRALGSLHLGVKVTELDIKLQVAMLDPRSANFATLCANGSDKDYNDNIILAVVMDLVDVAKKNHKTRPILVTKDIALRVKADSVGVATEDYKAGQVKEEIEEDVPVFDSLSSEIDNLYQGYKLELEEANLPVNTFLMLEDEGGRQAMARISESDDNGSHCKIVKPPTVYGLSSRNREQAFSLDLLTDPNISCVALVGPAGTGKSIIALAAGLEQVVQKKLYKKVIVCRVPIPMGKDIGFLPGSMQEKLTPWLGMVTDNFEVLNEMKNGKGKGGAKEVKLQMENLESFGMFEMASTSHIRGRSLPDSFIIIEEAQNASPHEIKSIISRAGKGTKVILLGDPDQIDVPYLDKYSNGLTFAVDRMSKDAEARKVFGSVHLVKSERSKLAELVGRLL